MRLPSRTVRIERSALEELRSMFLPAIEDGACVFCGGREALVSPPYIDHTLSCGPSITHRVVSRIIDGGIFHAKFPAKGKNK